jgi:16S rRNA (adenine1518-N6/adenine1519-N6)-dimethyltransferase
MSNKFELTNIKDLKVAMKLAGLSAKKSLGQNFLVDREALDSILASANLSATDTVVEIGPGMGVLTTELVQQAKQVVALEADAELARLLDSHDYTNLQVVEGDALKYQLDALTADYKVSPLKTTT